MNNGNLYDTTARCTGLKAVGYFTPGDSAVHTGVASADGKRLIRNCISLMREAGYPTYLWLPCR